MQRRLPSLNALRCFEVVAAYGSVKGAASVLNISESAISRQVRILEGQLGLALFARTHRGLEITEEGKQIAAVAKTAFDHIAEAIDPLRGDNDVVTLRVIPTFALRWLLPRLRRFHEANPTIRIIVQTRLNDLMQADTGADLGIRYGLGDFSHDHAIALYQEWIVPVCAPGHMRADDPEAGLKRATLLHPLPDRQDWVTWAEKTGVDLRAREGLDFDALDMALNAAAAGLGVAIADVVLAEQAIRDGHLIIPIRRAVPTGVSYFLVRRPVLKRRRQVRIVEEWLMDEIGQARSVVAGFANEKRPELRSATTPAALGIGL
ncbi:MAG: LysR substrate-binding domain-containing protein [Pseudochelatococcus sp.]|jgi:LysR family glycine cleavage system transcriptional activator|uniref:LysR substrate-binding domain-containing protein n=1 Tax=Pseudochelatococcus sp. TaxID=2020869 RepID=UPI003D89E11C